MYHLKNNLHTLHHVHQKVVLTKSHKRVYKSAVKQVLAKYVVKESHFSSMDVSGVWAAFFDKGFCNVGHVFDLDFLC